jgi:hypothetical protein
MWSTFGPQIAEAKRMAVERQAQAQQQQKPPQAPPEQP